MNSTSIEGRAAESNHLLFHEVIQSFSEQNIILDFEGSSIPGIKISMRDSDVAKNFIIYGIIINCHSLYHLFLSLTQTIRNNCISNYKIIGSGDF